MYVQVLQVAWILCENEAYIGKHDKLHVQENSTFFWDISTLFPQKKD